MLSTTPAFNLKVVLNETGITADTLRAWERRYGLPLPQRSPGGHRLYSQRDIETIKWLMKRQAEGLSISRAVDLWKEQIAAGSDPLAEGMPQAPAPAVLHPSAGTTLDRLRADWIDACLSFSETTAEQILNQGFSLFPVETVCEEVLQKGMSAIGDLWYENRASVQQEHFASNLAMRRLDALLTASPAPTRDKTVIVGCPPNEWHALTPLLLCLLLRRRGLNVLFLGANVPVSRFTEAVRSVQADLVILIAQQLTSAATLQSCARELADQNIPVAFGGRIFSLRPNLNTSIAGHYLGHALPSALEAVESILSGNSTRYAPGTISQAYLTASQAFAARRAQIEFTVQESLEPLALSSEDIETGLHFLGNNIAAALQLGEIAHVSAELDWLKTLLQFHNRPSQQLLYFLEIYAEAIRKTLHDQGEPILAWLASEAEKLRSA